MDPSILLMDLLDEMRVAHTESVLIEDLLERMLEVVCAAAPFDAERRGAVFLSDSGKLRLAAQHNIEEPLRRRCALIQFGQCLCGRVAQQRSPISAPALDERHEIRFEGIEDHGHYVVPIEWEDELLGVLNVYTEPGSRPDRQARMLIDSAASLAALAIRGAESDARILNEHSYRQVIFDTTLDAMLMGDDDGRIIDANAAASRLTGYGHDELLTMRPWDTTPVDNRNAGYTLWRAFIAESRKEGNYPLLRKDGSVVEVEYRAVANIVSGVHLLALRDVSADKRRERALRLLADGSVISSAAMDEQERFRRLCECAVAAGFRFAWAGLPRSGSRGKVATRACAPDDVDGRESAIGRGLVKTALRRGGAVFDAEGRRDAEWGAMCAIGFMVDDRRRGVLLLGDPGPARFETDAVRILEQLAQAITHGLRTVHSRAERDLLMTAIEQVPESIFMTDRRGVIVYVNPAMESQTGYSRTDLVGQTPGILKSGRHSDKFYRHLWTTILAGKPFNAVFENRKKDGSSILEEKFIVPITGPQGDITNFISTGRDVTQRKELEEELHYLAYSDPLTGFGNRRIFIEKGQQVLSVASRGESAVCLLLMDLDNFKRINDTLGHQAGDDLLIEVGKRIDSELRDSDVLARFGGDEFAILLTFCGQTQVQNVSQRIVDRLKEPFQVPDRSMRMRTVFVGSSIGIACFPDDAADIDELLRKADIAMYRVKGEGGGFACYNPAADIYTHSRLEIENELRQAVESCSLDAAFQPVVALSDSTVLGVETLARWRHASRGDVPPAEFIPIAEESGYIIELDRYILRRAVQYASQWRDQELRFSVNLSAQSFLHPDLVDEVRSLLSRHEVAPTRLCLEITERTLADPEAVGPVIRRFQDLGTTVAVDDFGTGYSSLSYLSRLAPDFIKMDKSFVQGIGRNQTDEGIAQGILAMARSLGMSVVAEGVETKHQLEWLAAHDCEFIQGFAIARPVPAAGLAAWLAAWRSGECEFVTRTVNGLSN